MPNFDGKGPLKRGRVIGRGRGPCRQGVPAQEDTSCSDNEEPKNKQKRS